MNKMIPMFLCAAALFGCKTRPITPEVSWADYGHYYCPANTAGVEIVSPRGAAEIREISSRDAGTTLAMLQSQGYVELGKFLISDYTEITYNAVAALAQKLNASVAVWTRENVIAEDSALPNAAVNIVGVDSVQMNLMNADRPDESKADQLIAHKHTIWMLGKKK